MGGNGGVGLLFVHKQELVYSVPSIYAGYNI